MWIYKNKVLENIPEGAVGFVYRITRLNIDFDCTSPIYYIGKKNFWTGKGKKIVESDWKKYYGSSNWLKTHVSRYGEDNFLREIIKVCYSKSEMTYNEVMIQLEEDVLSVHKRSVMKKKYYNLNVLGKFYKSKEFSKEELNQIYNYINTGSDEYQKIYVTDGSKTQIINGLVENIDEWLLEHPSWYLGTSFYGHNKGKVQVTNGETSIYINEQDEYNFLLENNEWYRGSHTKGKMVCVNDGINTRRIHISEIDIFLDSNPEYTIGSIKKLSDYKYKHIYNVDLHVSMYVRGDDIDEYLNNGWSLQNGVPRGKYIWVNKDYKDKKININDKERYLSNGWVEGRVAANNKNKICITNGVENKYIYIGDDVPEDWYYGATQDRSNICKRKYVYNPTTNHMISIKVDDFEVFLQENPDYKPGKNYSHSEDKVFAINMSTLERCEVTKEEFNNNRLLTTMKTKRVKIKRKNRIIFSGYLYIYLLDNTEIPERFFKEALKSETGLVQGRTKQYDWIEKEELYIRYL